MSRTGSKSSCMIEFCRQNEADSEREEAPGLVQDDAIVSLVNVVVGSST